MRDLLCAVCLYDESRLPPEPALTVIEGYAVCEHHLGFVAQGERFAGIIRTAREQPRTADDDGA